MGLSGKDLGKALELAVHNAPNRPEDGADAEALKDYRESIFEEMGRTIVNYIQDNAEIHVVVPIGAIRLPAAPTGIITNASRLSWITKASGTPTPNNAGTGGVK